MELFKAGNRIRHKKCLDMDLIVSRVIHCSDDEVILEVYYWSRFYKTLMISNMEEITINKDQYSNWRLIEEINHERYY